VYNGTIRRLIRPIRRSHRRVAVSRLRRRLLLQLIPSLGQPLLGHRQFLLLPIDQQAFMLKRLLGQVLRMRLQHLLHDNVNVLVLVLTEIRQLRLFTIVPAQTGHLTHRQMCVGVALVNDSIGHALLVDLTIVDFLLQRIVHDQAVDKAGFLLAVAIDTADGLGVVAGVEAGVEDDDTVGADEIDAWKERLVCERNL
jgi:hypothetical protein